MSLAAPRKRRKIGNDPNNTAWTNNENTYGRRILTSQGWTPGSYLGAKNAAHASLHTAANSSHIRVTLREENLGLGARQAGAWSDPLADAAFGLGGFQDLLGRLNGKSEGLLEKERAARNDIERDKYLERKWGAKGGMGRFVKGGLLVGDRILDHQSPLVPQSDEEGVKNDSDHSSHDEITSTPTTKDLKAGKIHAKGKKEKKEKKKERSERGKEESVIVPGSVTPITEGTSQTKEERRKQKLERRARKEAKRLKKAKALSGKLDTEDITLEDADDSTKPATQSTEISSTKAQTTLSNGRHMVRQRYIRQKQMSMMDPTALKEILMLKS